MNIYIVLQTNVYRVLILILPGILIQNTILVIFFLTSHTLPWGHVVPQESVQTFYMDTNEHTLRQTSKLYLYLGLRPSFISTFNSGYICEHLLLAHYKTKSKTSLRD